MIRKIAQAIVGTILVMWAVLAVGFTVTLFADGLEYEKTGACRECVIIPIFRPDINKLFAEGEIK